MSVKPAILITSEADLDHLLDEFGRYARDYDVLGAASVSEATQIVERMAAGGQPVALLVVDSRLTGVGQVDGYQVMHTLRTLVPTARRLVTSRWENFLEDSKTLRPAVAKGKIDVVALTPRGPRDEEYHSGVIDLLNDWNAMATPEVDSIQLVTPRVDALTRSLREFKSPLAHANEMASDLGFYLSGRGLFSSEVLEKVLSVAEMGGKAVYCRPLHGRGDVGVDVHRRGDR